MNKSNKKLVIVVTSLVLVSIGFLSTYYYTYSEVYYRNSNNYGPMKKFQNTEMYLSIQTTKEGHKKTLFGNEYRSPYRISFVFKGKKGEHELIQITDVTVKGPQEQQDLIQDGRTLSKKFERWPNGTWGTNFETRKVFDLNFKKNHKILVQATCTLTIKGQKHDVKMAQEFKSAVRKESGFSAIDFLFGYAGLI